MKYCHPRPGGVKRYDFSSAKHQQQFKTTDQLSLRRVGGFSVVEALLTDLLCRPALCHFAKPLPLTHIGVFPSQSPSEHQHVIISWRHLKALLCCDQCVHVLILYKTRVRVCFCVCACAPFVFVHVWKKDDRCVWGRVSELNKMLPIPRLTDFHPAVLLSGQIRCLFPVILQIQHNLRLHEGDKQ